VSHPILVTSYFKPASAITAARKSISNPDTLSKSINSIGAYEASVATLIVSSPVVVEAVPASVEAAGTGSFAGGVPQADNIITIINAINGKK